MTEKQDLPEGYIQCLLDLAFLGDAGYGDVVSVPSDVPDDILDILKTIARDGLICEGCKLVPAGVCPPCIAHQRIDALRKDAK